jgi:hypothetical protein
LRVDSAAIAEQLFWLRVSARNRGAPEWKPMSEPEKWVVRLSPVTGHTVDDLLQMPYALDVWQRDGTSLVVSAPDATLVEIERRKLARVERMGPTEQFAAQASTERRKPD